MNNKELKKNLALISAKKSILINDYYVSRVGIFGSVARGDFTRASDVDILVEFSKPVGMFHFLDLENFLNGILHKKVDLVTRRALKSTIKKTILHEVVYA